VRGAGPKSECLLGGGSFICFMVLLLPKIDVGCRRRKVFRDGA
jgi:hypothetical protein